MAVANGNHSKVNSNYVIACLLSTLDQPLSSAQHHGADTFIISMEDTLCKAQHQGAHRASGLARAWPCTSQRKLGAMASALGAHLLPAVSPAGRVVPGTWLCSTKTSQVNEFQASSAHLRTRCLSLWLSAGGNGAVWAQSLPQGRKKFPKLSYCFQLGRSKGRDVAPKDNSPSLNRPLPSRQVRKRG